MTLPINQITKYTMLFSFTTMSSVAIYHLYKMYPKVSFWSFNNVLAHDVYFTGSLSLGLLSMLSEYSTRFFNKMLKNN